MAQSSFEVAPATPGPPVPRAHHDEPVETLDAAEREALVRLERADGHATRWLVGREVARSLADRQLVLVTSDFVLLTDAGRRALEAGSW